jgi:hypothetical protein
MGELLHGLWEQSAVKKSLCERGMEKTKNLYAHKQETFAFWDIAV